MAPLRDDKGVVEGVRDRKASSTRSSIDVHYMCAYTYTCIDVYIRSVMTIYKHVYVSEYLREYDYFAMTRQRRRCNSYTFTIAQRSNVFFHRYHIAFIIIIIITVHPISESIRSSSGSSTSGSGSSSGGGDVIYGNRGRVEIRLSGDRALWELICEDTVQSVIDTYIIGMGIHVKW